MPITKPNQITGGKYEKEDLDPKQELDWGDDNQRYCKKHKRNYHLSCRACNP